MLCVLQFHHLENSGPILIIDKCSLFAMYNVINCISCDENNFREKRMETV